MAYKAKQGDIIWLSLDPQSGHEQKGRRPALVISNDVFNEFAISGALVCPISSVDRRNPLQPSLDSRTKTQGVIMCDQVKALDIVAREASFIERVPYEILANVINIVCRILEIVD